MTARHQRAQNALFFRLNVLPFIGVFFMGVIGAKASYPIIRWLCFLSGPLGFLRAEAFRVDRLHFHSGGMTGPLGSIVGAAFCLFLLAQEQRRKSPTLLLWRNRLYRVGLLAFMASCFISVAMVDRSALSFDPVQVMTSIAAAAFLASAWPQWGQTTRIGAITLLVLAYGFGIFTRYLADLWALKG